LVAGEAIDVSARMISKSPENARATIFSNSGRP